MKIYIDTAELPRIKDAYSSGIIDGVTTNPSLMQNVTEQYSDMDMEKYIREIFGTVGKKTHVSLEVGALTEDEMCREALILYRKFGKYNIAIKVPVNPDINGEPDYDALKVIRYLRKKKIPVK